MFDKPKQSHFAVSASRSIREYSDSMKNRGVINFQHDITFGQGQVSMLGPHPEMFLFYDKNKIPLACTDESGRVLRDGIYINKILEDEHQDYSVLMSLFIQTSRNNGFNYGKNVVHYVSREQDCQHLYSLFFDFSYNDFLHFVINNGALLQDLIENYNLAAKDIILEAKSVTNRIVMPNYSDIYVPSKSKSQAHTKQICLLHKNTHLPVHLSTQRSQCLVYLMQGKSTKEIAFAMNLSIRTVEFYLNILRKQLGCCSIKELIRFYGNQLSQ